MGRGNLSASEMEILRQNPNVVSVSPNQVVYSQEFKLHFMEAYMAGSTPTQIFREAGFDPLILGSKRIERAAARWKESYAAGKIAAEGYMPAEELRKHYKTNKPTKKQRDKTASKISSQEYAHQKEISEINREHKKQITKQQERIEELEAQVEALKKAGRLGRRRCDNKVYGKIELCEFIEDIYESRQGLVSISALCKALEVPRSTYYYYLNHKENREKREEKDMETYFFVEMVFSMKKQRCKGSRSIKDTLAIEYDIVYNRKRIQRIMRKYGLKCPLKTKNPYRDIWKATKEDKIAPNLLKRQFKPGEARKVLLTDITYIKHQDAFSYLSVIIDSETNEPLAYKLSPNLKVDFVIDTLNQLDQSEFADGIMLHSDQGVHYSSKAFRERLEEMDVTQSMSRKGNCHDNAPMESFFGHMKGEVAFNKDWSFEQLQAEIDEYMHDYRYHRHVKGAERMTPYEYGATLLNKVA